jgi:hypothetical protein
MPKDVHDRAKKLMKKGLPEDVAWGRAWNEKKGKTKSKGRKKK